MKKKKWAKRAIILAIIVSIFIWLGNSVNVPVKYRTAEVESGDIIVSISGTGTIKPTESRKEISKVNARVESIFFEEGDVVKTGDVLVKLDSTDYEQTVNSQKNSLEQAQISKENANRQLKNLKIISNADGFVDNLNISEGSYVVTNTKICDVLVPNKYEIKLQFLASENYKIDVGNTANVFLLNSYSYITGTVSYVGTNKHVLQNGSNVIDVIIEIDSTEYVLDGWKANATVVASSGSAIKSANDGTFTSSKANQILSGSTGTVTKLYVKDGAEVKKGDVIAELQNLDLTANVQSSSISVDNLNQQLEYSQSKLEDYAISATIEGVITAQNIKVGDWVSTGTLVSTVSNMETFEFLVPVDELDISKVSKENKVLVSIDALPETIENPIEGKITKLSLEGVTVGGVTDYYATVEIPYVEGLRIAMNASADIVISESLQTLKVPVECVTKESGKYYVEVINGEEKVKREVQVGIQNSSYYEIIDGLTAGEEIYLPQQNLLSIF